MEHHFLGFNPHSLYPPPSMHQIFQEQDLFRELDLLDLDFPTSLDNYVGSNGEQEDEDGMMLTDLLLSSSSSSNSSTGFTGSSGSSSSPISMSNDYESFELVSVESEGDLGAGVIGSRETTAIRTDDSKENEETDEDEIVWLDKQNNPIFFSSEDEEDDTDGDDQSKPACVSLISSEESGSESETAESEAQQSDDGQVQEGIATEAAGFGCEVEISHNINNEKDSSPGHVPISLSCKRTRSSAPPQFQNLQPPPPPPSEPLNTLDCSSDDSDNNKSKQQQQRSGRSSSPALSTTSTISIKDEDYDENGIYNQNRFHFDHDTLIQWEHSYAMPVSPPPQPPPSRAKVNRVRFQPQRRKRRQQKDAEEFGERAALTLIPVPVPVPVRRSPRSACQESASKIRKIINDSILSDLSDVDESETEDGERSGRQSGSQEPQPESCIHEDWKWEIEEYSNYLSLRESEIESNGVFAKYAIPAQVCFIEYKGKRVKTSEVDGIESNYRSEGILHDYMFRIDENVTIDATEYCSENLSKYINHSCSPNAYSVEMVLYGKKRIILMSLREIQPDEEITYDYLFPPESDPTKRLPCNCHAANCRGFIN